MNSSPASWNYIIKVSQYRWDNGELHIPYEKLNKFVSWHYLLSSNFLRFTSYSWEMSSCTLSYPYWDTPDIWFCVLTRRKITVPLAGLAYNQFPGEIFILIWKFYTERPFYYTNFLIFPIILDNWKCLTKNESNNSNIDAIAWHSNITLISGILERWRRKESNNI